MNQYLAVLVSSLGFMRAMTIDDVQLHGGVVMGIQRHFLDRSPADAQIHMRTKFTCESIVHWDDASAPAIAAVRTACDSGAVSDVGRFSSVYMMAEKYFERHPAGELTRVLEAIRTAHERIAKLEENLNIAGLRADVAEQAHALKLRRIAELEVENAKLNDIVAACDPALIEQRVEMNATAHEYYRLLDKLDGTTSDELIAIKNHLDELSAPFIENQAFVALLERKRMIKEDSADRIRELTGQNISLRSLIETLKTAG